MTDVETGTYSCFLILLKDTYATWLTLLCRCVGLDRLAKLGGGLELEAPPLNCASGFSVAAACGHDEQGWREGGGGGATSGGKGCQC